MDDTFAVKEDDQQCFDLGFLQTSLFWSRGNRPQKPDLGSKEDDHAQLLSSEPGIGAHGSNCMQGHYRGLASIFQSCATLAEPAGYDVAIV